MMRVVQINGVSRSGSTGRIVSQLSEVMNRRNIENYIISSGYKEKKAGDNVYFCSSYPSVKLHQYLGTLFGDAGFHSGISTSRLIRKLDELKPDIVHLHNIYSYYLNVEKLTNYLKKKNIVTVWTLHDFWPITGHCVHFEAAGCEKWKTGCKNCPQKRSYPYSYLLDRSKKLYNRKKALFSDWKRLYPVGVSDWVRENAAESFLKERDVRVIANGVDTGVFREKQVEKPAKLRDKFVILSVAMSWSKQKGLDNLIKMSKLMTDDEILLLIGLPQAIIEGLPDNILGMGRTSTAEELVDWYNIADVCVSASVEETMGLTIAESMACGTPAVVYNETALPELITEECGKVCEKGAENLYRAISAVRVTGKKAYSAHCVARIAEHYNKEKQYEKYCDLYEYLTGSIT